MLRIHFTAQDLARVTIAAEPDPLWEMLLSLHLMQGQDGELVYGPWRGQVRASVPAAEMRLLCELAPPSGYSPDFLTPVGSGPAFDTAVDRLMATPRSRVQADLRNLASRQAPTEWTRSLASGSPTAMRRLGQAMRSYHGKALRPYWPSIRQHVVADRARRVAELATLGIDHVLATLHPGIRWEPPVLQITEFADHDVFSSFPQRVGPDRYAPGPIRATNGRLRLNGVNPARATQKPTAPGPTRANNTASPQQSHNPSSPQRPSPEQSHHLDGRGLLLQPSFFCRHAPTKLPDTGLPPVLVYPTQPPPGTLQRQQNPARPSSLESLMGRTRAIALEATVSGCTTSALARVCGISVGAASQQATVLRDANLITTRRQGLAVLHEITPLGLDLLTAATVRP